MKDINEMINKTKTNKSEFKFLFVLNHYYHINITQTVYCYYSYYFNVFDKALQQSSTRRTVYKGMFFLFNSIIRYYGSLQNIVCILVLAELFFG